LILSELEAKNHKIFSDIELPFNDYLAEILTVIKLIDELNIFVKAD